MLEMGCTEQGWAGHNNKDVWRLSINLMLLKWLKKHHFGEINSVRMGQNFKRCDVKNTLNGGYEYLATGYGYGYEQVDRVYKGLKDRVQLRKS